jgi:hypothetical protein
MPEDNDPWRVLLSEAASELPEVLGTLEMLPGADTDDLPSALSGVSGGVIGQAIVRGPQQPATRLLERLAPIYQQALEADDPSPVGRLGMLATAGVLTACGQQDVDPAQLLDRWLDELLGRLGDLTDQERTSLGLTCAALGFDEAVPEVIGDLDGGAYEPGQDFGASAQGYAHYLVAAAAAGATTDDFRAAWASFVAYFPLRLETGGLRWRDLLWAGYGAYTRIFGYDPGEVAQGLHEYVLEFAEL